MATNEGQVAVTMDSPRAPSTISLKSSKLLSKGVRKIMEEADVDGDGTLSLDEVCLLVEKMVKEREKSMVMKWIIIGLVVFTCCLLGAICGMTYGIVSYLKDSKVQGAVMVNNDGQTIQVASTDMTIDPATGMLVTRNTAAANQTGTNTTKSNPITTATSFFSHSISSKDSLKSLAALNSLCITKNSTSQVCLSVMGAARIPLSSSSNGYIVKLITTTGTIILDNNELSFSSDIAPVFKEAGFVMDSTGRRLLADNSISVSGTSSSSSTDAVWESVENNDDYGLITRWDYGSTTYMEEVVVPEP